MIRNTKPVLMRIQATQVMPELEMFAAGMQDLSLLVTAIGIGASMARVGFGDSVNNARGQTAATKAVLQGGTQTAGYY
jgi:hypothetical protein